MIDTLQMYGYCRPIFMCHFARCPSAPTNAIESNSHSGHFFVRRRKVGNRNPDRSRVQFLVSDILPSNGLDPYPPIKCIQMTVYFIAGKVDTHNNLFNYISIPYSYPNGAASMVSSFSIFPINQPEINQCLNFDVKLSDDNFTLCTQSIALQYAFTHHTPAHGAFLL